MFAPSVEELAYFFPQISGLEFLERGGQKIVLAGSHSIYGDIVLKLTRRVDKRTRREIDIVTSKEFPGVPNLHEWGTLVISDQNVWYIIEERVRGRTLRSILQQSRKLELHHALQLLEFLLESAVRFEAERLVHRDLKPENIMIGDNGQLFILDFGIARALDQTSLTATADSFGPATLGYAAPEQYRNMKKELDARADLFSIGTVFYECITGTNPFIEGASSLLDVIKRSEMLQVEKLDLECDTDGSLAAFIDTLMQKWPSRRPRTAAEAWDWYKDIRSNLHEV